MYRRILLAYDGTIEGRRALREGALLAIRCGAEVFLLSVIPESAGVLMAEGAQSGAVAQFQKTYQAVLDEAVVRMKQFGFKPNAKLVWGDPAQQIGAYARQIKADLVVVGHRKVGLIERWWSGPSGAYLLDKVECSLLIGRHDIGDEIFEAELKRAAAERA
ncbi:MAG: universal stress protein [Caulobacterales bacterium]